MPLATLIHAFLLVTDASFLSLAIKAIFQHKHLHKAFLASRAEPFPRAKQQSWQAKEVYLGDMFWHQGSLLLYLFHFPVHDLLIGTVTTSAHFGVLHKADTTPLSWIQTLLNSPFL